jgi:hypothetical protein
MQRQIFIVQSSSSNSFLNMAYLQTREFFTSLLILLSSLIGVILINYYFANWSVAKYYTFVAITGIIIAILIIFLNFFNFFKKFNSILWDKPILIVNAIQSVLILVASILVTIEIAKPVFKHSSKYKNTLIASSVFGYIVFVLYLMDCILRFQRANRLHSITKKTVYNQKTIIF